VKPEKGIGCEPPNGQRNEQNPKLVNVKGRNISVVADLLAEEKSDRNYHSFNDGSHGDVIQLFYHTSVQLLRQELPHPPTRLSADDRSPFALLRAGCKRNMPS